LGEEKKLDIKHMNIHIQANCNVWRIWFTPGSVTRSVYCIHNTSPFPLFYVSVLCKYATGCLIWKQLSMSWHY